jgi:hypothetical protein
MSTLSNEILDSEIVTLQRTREEIIGQLKLERRRLREVEIELATLRRLQQRIATTPAPNVQTEDHQSESNGEQKALFGEVSDRIEQLKGKPSQAVLEIVRRRPGIRLGVVVAMLRDRIETSSSDPKKLLYSIIGQLEKRGALSRGGESNRELYVTERGLGEAADSD